MLQQATSTAYPTIGRPSDDPDLLKGLAGSPYAIKDYFDVCPDYAQNPARRLDEFGALLSRIHGHDMKALIDFVPNHVARSIIPRSGQNWILVRTTTKRNSFAWTTISSTSRGAIHLRVKCLHSNCQRMIRQAASLT